ncbi:4-(cytidine 5'-diphospho)-2-C-methyl-D-erythritol kinase [Candidatus Margulisiibacteriota bacterium]
MKLKAYAKINLSLRVLDQRPDGFHNIESIMQTVSLHDCITLSLIPAGIEVTCDNPKVPLGPANLAYKAAELAGAKGLKIHIEKRIPMAAGLAGGSADAAAVLFGLKADPAIAEQVGSDVPFCLVGGTCLVGGRGEKVTRTQPPVPSTYILVCPDIEISAKWAYDEWDRQKAKGKRQEAKGLNDLEPVVAAKYPVINEIKEKLLSLGCSAAQMSGSGPAVFGIVRQKAEAEKIFTKIKEEYSRSFVVEAADKGIEII